MKGPRLDHQKTDRYRYEASESSVEIFGSFFGLKLAGKLGLVNQFTVNSHDLRQIEIPSPSNNINPDCPGKEHTPGFGCVFIHHFLLSARQATQPPPPRTTNGKIILLKNNRMMPPILNNPTFFTMAWLSSVRVSHFTRGISSSMAKTAL